MKSVLFICFTPLQILIAREIILTERIKDAKLLIIELSYNEKLRLYLNKSKSLFNSEVKFFVPKGKNKVAKLGALFKFIALNYSFLKVETLYIASLHDRFLQILYLVMNPKYLITFDDGVGNIYKESIFYNSKTVKSLFLRKAIYHYTIFPDLDNILPSNKVRTVIFPKIAKDSTLEHPTKTVKIFIGQPFLELNNCINEDYIIRVLSELNIDYYIMHPREKLNTIVNEVVSVINTDLILEDYLSEYLTEHSDTLLQVYSLNSTGLITTMNLDRVTVHAISNKCLNESYKSLYDLFNSLHIPVLEIE